MTIKNCKHCNEDLPIDDFYIVKNRTWPYCKKCESMRKKQQLVNFKRACLGYKNEFCCKLCGYDKCISSLDFHHLDPTKKDFNISRCKNLYLNDSIKLELDKCDVICANCHRELHALQELNFSPHFLKPKSISYCSVCNKQCTSDSQFCIECYSEFIKTKSKKPTKEILAYDLKTLKYKTTIGKKYEVSGNTITKWLKSYDLI